MGGIFIIYNIISNRNRTEYDLENSDKLKLREFILNKTNIVIILVLLLIILGLFIYCKNINLLIEDAEYAEGINWNYILIIPLLISIIIIFCGLFLNDRKYGIEFKIKLDINEYLYLILFSIFLLGYYSYYLGSWKFSIVGDDFEFYWLAKSYCSKGLMRIPWLEASGGYGDIPFALTGLQVIVMKIFGENHIGWKFSSSLITTSCVIPLYLTLRYYLNGISRYPKIISMLSCSAFFLSEQITVWARVGKPCNVGIFTCIFSVCLLIGGLNRNSCLYIYLSGIICGLGLYFNIIGPCVTIPTLGLVIIYYLYLRLGNIKSIWNELIPIFLLISGFIISGIPNLVQTDYIIHQFWKHLSESNLDNEVALINLMQRSFSGLTFFLNRNGNNSTFMVGNVIDPITCSFMILGIISIRRIGIYKWSFIIFQYLFIVIVTCIISPYNPPSLTRTMYIVFPIIFLMGIGLDSFLDKINNKRSVIIISILIGCFIFIYNFLKINEYNPYHFPREYEMHFLQKMETSNVEDRYIIIFPQNKDPFIGQMLNEEFGYENRVIFINENEDGYNKMKEFGKPAEVIMLDECKNIEQIKKVSDELGYKISEYRLPWYGTPKKG